MGSESRLTAGLMQMSALGVGIGALLLYLGTLSQHHSADSLIYALEIEAGEEAAMVDPSHLLIHPLGWAWGAAWRALGWTGRLMVPLQAFNALGGAACVALLAAIAARLTGRRGLALAAALGFAVSGGLWLLSTEAEFVTIPLALQLAVLAMLLGAGAQRRGTAVYALGLGALAALAAAAYLTSLLALAAAAAALWADDALDARRKLRQMVLMAIACAAVLGGALALLRLKLGTEAWAGAWGNVGAVAYYGAVTPSDVPQGIYALLRSLALFGNLGMNDSTRAFWGAAGGGARVGFVGYYALVLLLAAAPFALAWRRRKELWARQRRELAALGVWSTAFGAFALWWVPGDFSFWMPVLAAWWIFAALVLESAEVRGRAGLLLSAAAALAAFNAAFLILPHRRAATNGERRAAEAAARLTAPADAIFVGEEAGMLLLNVLYFGERETAYAPEAGASREVAGEYREFTADVEQRGGRLYALGDAQGSAAVLERDALPVGPAGDYTLFELVPRTP